MSLGQDEAIAIKVKGARASFRRMVPGFGHDAHEGKALEDAPGKRRIDAADSIMGSVPVAVGALRKPARQWMKCSRW